MHTAVLLFPDLCLILLGYALMRWSPLGAELWLGVEKLVYFVLFPVLLFSTSSRASYTMGSAALLLEAGIGALLCGIALAYAGSWLADDKRCAASGAQCAFRFNSYIALAVADRLGGPAGVSMVAVLMAFGVPLCNAAAVWPLARHGNRGLLGELARNPLIIATVTGLLFHALGLRPPTLLLPALDRLSASSIALGLMTVGAGLRLRGLHREWKLSGWLLAVRHALLPACGLLLARLLHLEPLQALIIVVFTAMPTASTCYVLAARMGGDATYVAGLVSLSTLLGAVSLPAFLALLG